MFEILALDQAQLIAFYTAVFGWEVERDAAGYAYIRFPPATYHLLGGIGQAKPGGNGHGKGATFYIQVEDLDATLKAVDANGGATVIGPTVIDDYHFAMFEDPECNLIGIIRPF